MTSLSFIDLHCDLLTYLVSNPNRTVYDSKVRCSIPQLKEGRVKLQVLAVWGITRSGSSLSGMSQIKLFQNLPILYPDEFKIVTQSADVDQLLTYPSIGIIPAFENASAFAEENEPLEDCFKRLQQMEAIAKPLYISLTWNSENRFGGGNLTTVGLKDDGRRLLDYLHQKKIAIDFSHTSDRLAEDLFLYMDQHHLDIPIMASHSNFRTVTDVPRNLPDDFVKEILLRRGIIGLNFVRSFIGGNEDLPLFVEHLAHGLSLGGSEQVAFGGDFFCDDDLPQELKSSIGPSFFEKYGDASQSYSRVMRLWKERLHISDELAKNVAYANALSFIQRVIR